MAVLHKTSCDNYRGITLSPVLSKVFELVLMNDLQSYLKSDNLQFGFKQNSSCAHAIFTLCSVVDHYCHSGSTVTICALDISKAFDRLDHYKLLSLLMDRKVILLRFFSVGFSAVCLLYGGVVLCCRFFSTGQCASGRSAVTSIVLYLRGCFNQQTTFCWTWL